MRGPALVNHSERAASPAVASRALRYPLSVIRRWFTSTYSTRCEVVVPPAITKMRSLTVSTSGRSEEISRIAIPLRSQPRDDPVYLRLCAPAAMACRLARAFFALVRDRDAAALDGWLDEAARSDLPEMGGFALGIRRDRAAVDAGLTLDWSQGQTEGFVNKLNRCSSAKCSAARVSTRCASGCWTEGKASNVGMSRFSVPNTLLSVILSVLSGRSLG